MRATLALRLGMSLHGHMNAQTPIYQPWLIVREIGERLLLDTLFWPDLIEFTSYGLKSLGAHRYRIRKGHIDILLDNGRAVYRIEERDVVNDRFRGMCVYSETW